MPDPLAGLPPRFLRTPEAARFLGLSGRTLEKHRTYGTGPKYRKIGGRVVYALEDLKAWADLGAKTSTSDPGVGTVFPAKRTRRIGNDPIASGLIVSNRVRCPGPGHSEASATSSNCFARFPATLHHAMRRTSWPIRSSASRSHTA